MTRYTLLFVTLTLSACLHPSKSRPLPAKSGYSRFDGTEFGWSGRLAGFVISPMEHIIVEKEDPIVSRDVRGILRSAGGEWPENIEIVFEIRGPSPKATVRSVLADPRGRFHVSGVPVGNYVFKATANGWQSIVGTIVVSKTAKANEVELVMPLGV